MLRIVDDTVELVGEVATLRRRIQGRDRHLGDQLHRAVLSVALNVAEGAASRGQKEGALFQVALGSARECVACVRIARVLGYVADPEASALIRRLDRVAGALWKLVHRR